MATIHWIDAMYQVYITGVVAIVALVSISSVVGDEKVSASTLADLRVHGPAVVGALFSAALFLGLRAGSRGGPLALERADVRYVLLSPVDRGVALRGPAWRQLRFLCFVGLAVGLAVGQLALRRLPGNGAAWMACGALVGLVAVGLYFGSALVASGLKVPQWLATLVGFVLLVWSVADAFGRGPIAPATYAGRLGTWPLHVDLIALVGPALALLLVAAGMRLVSGTSLEAAERRTSLVGQLRFAVTLQDLRTVLVLRRQLAQERPRSRPWIPALRTGPARLPVFRRGVRSVMRWPLSRIVRVLVLAVTAGFALRGVWDGTTPLVIVAGIALWIAGLDAAEPLGQEVDHPGRTDGFPLERGQLFVDHLPLVGLVSSITGLIAGGVAAAPIGTGVPANVAIIVGLSAGLLAGCGAVVSVVQGAPDAVDVLAIATPEIAGTRTVIRTVWPPGLAVLGTLPILAARASFRGVQNPPPAAAAATVFGLLMIVVGIFAGWVRFRDNVHAFLREAADAASPTKAAERASAARAEEAEREREALAESRRLGGVEDESDDDEAAATKAKPKAAPRPTTPKPKPAPAQPGVQGGTSAKPIGRKRDQRP